MSDISGETSAAVGTAGLSRKVGKLPVWGWALLIVGGLVLVYYFYSRKASSTAASTQTGTLSDAGTAADYQGALSTMYGTGTGGGTNFSNNQQWAQAAISELQGNSSYSPLDIEQAVGNLESGSPLNTNQQSIINKIIGLIGAPPESTPAPVYAPVATAPAPTTTTTNPRATTNPWSPGAVYAIGSKAGTQFYINSRGARNILTKQQVANARAQGYGYQVTVVSR